MALWRVDVGGISSRMVEAETQKAAEQLVRDALIDALDVRGSRAPRSLSAYYDSLGPIQKKNFLVATDGLSSPASRRDASSSRKRLERQLAYDERIREWSEGAEIPAPVDPERLARLTMYFEVDRIERAKRRLKEHERRLYSDAEDGTGYSL